MMVPRRAPRAHQQVPKNPEGSGQVATATPRGNAALTDNGMPRVLSGTNAVLFTPWVERAAQQVGTNPGLVAYALRQFIDGVPFVSIASASGLTRKQIMDLYWMPWQSAASLPG